MAHTVRRAVTPAIRLNKFGFESRLLLSINLQLPMYVMSQVHAVRRIATPAMRFANLAFKSRFLLSANPDLLMYVCVGTGPISIFSNFHREVYQNLAVISTVWFYEPPVCVGTLPTHTGGS